MDYFCTAYFCCSSVLGSPGSWPILLALSVIPSLVSIAIMYFMPESPRYLILTLGKVDEGRKALSQLRGSEESSAQVEAEVKEILAEKRQQEEEEGLATRVTHFSSVPSW